MESNQKYFADKKRRNICLIAAIASVFLVVFFEMGSRQSPGHHVENLLPVIFSITSGIFFIGFCQLSLVPLLVTELDSIVIRVNNFKVVRIKISDISHVEIVANVANITTINGSNQKVYLSFFSDADKAAIKNILTSKAAI